MDGIAGSTAGTAAPRVLQPLAQVLAPENSLVDDDLVAATVQRILERGRMMQLDVASMPTRHRTHKLWGDVINLSEFSRIHPSDFPKLTRAEGCERKRLDSKEW